MRKNRIFLGVLLLVFGISSAVSANLITNPGFEEGTGLGDWTPSGDARSTSSTTWAHTGMWGGIINNEGALKQNITLSDASTHIFGGYVRIWTREWAANWDQVQASLWAHIPAEGETFGTDPGNLGTTYFTEVPDFEGGGFITDWIYFEKELLTPGFGGYAAVLNLNINTSDNGKITIAAFDDVFVRAVPEPSTILLLFAGIIGLAVTKRSKAKGKRLNKLIG